VAKQAYEVPACQITFMDKSLESGQHRREYHTSAEGNYALKDGPFGNCGAFPL
jgi:hypothetical protein